MHRKLICTVVSILCAGAGLLPAATLEHRYQFSADAADSVGSSHGSLINGAAIIGGAVQLDGSSAYVDLPDGILSSYSSVSIEAWVTDLGSATWARIFDFGSGTMEYMFLSPQGNSGALRGAISTNSYFSEQVMEWSATRLPVGTPVHVVWTYDGGSNAGKLYVDGVLADQNLSMTLAPSDLGFTTQNWLGRSQFSDPYFYGSMDEFRIYDGALTDAEVQNNYQFGPDALPFGQVFIEIQPQNQTVIEGEPVTFSITASGEPPITAQWYSNGVAIADATNLSYTMTASLADNGAAYHAELSNIFFGYTFHDTSSNAILSVSADTVAPVLEGADSIYPNGIRVIFSEPVSAATALNTANYSISGNPLTITGAAYGDDSSTVILSTSAQSDGTLYTLHVSNVQDLAAAANTIAPDSQDTFIASEYIVDDIGGPVIEGSATFSSNGVDVTSGGADIGGTSDNFTFTHKTYAGNFDIQVRVDGLDFSDVWARAGLMARDGLDADSRFAAAFSTSGPAGCQFMSRSSIGATAAVSGYFPSTYPGMWLRLRRTGNLFEGFAGIDGETWQRLGSVTISMPVSVEVGLALCSGDASESITARFRDESAGSGSMLPFVELPFEPLGPSSRRGAMVISEIMVDAPAAWGGTNSLEFVEIYNTGLITEDLTGHRFSGEIDYTFPDGTALEPGEFIVIAKDPAAAQSFYGVSCLGPYDGKLANNGGTLRFRNELDAVLLEVEYDNRPPWPAAAFGTGHSLTLSHPSYGENDARAWSASDVIGGSPGTFGGYGSEAARAVVINEYLSHTDLPQRDYIELFNSGASAVDLSGFWLSDTAGTNRYRIADGTVIAGRDFLSFDETQLGFALSADGEAIYLVNSNQTRVIDAVVFRGQANGVAEGRYPDGAPGFQVLSAVTEGSTNAVPALPPVVINEIMYHPISDSNNDEYIELYNRSGSPVDLSNWRLQDGVSYQFPEGVVIPADGYVVVAENLTNLLAHYAQLNVTNTFGNYSGALNNYSERIALSRPEDQILTNDLGQVVGTNIYYVPIDEVTYLDGGRWGEWSDGGGSSLELIDPDADNRQPGSWADSDETSKAPWTTIDVTNVLENGQYFTDEGSSYGQAYQANRLELMLQGAGESIVDDVEFLKNNGTDLVQNGDFAGGLGSWGAGGVFRHSSVQSGIGIGGSDALHVVAAARGDTGCNKIYNQLDSTPPITGTTVGTIRAKARWLKGSKQILIRLRGNWMEVCQDLAVPDDLGTPGLANSRLVANAGPAIYDVVHSPVLPSSSEAVRITARATDPDGTDSMTLNYRIDPSTNVTSIAMTDSGTAGDVVAGDGIFSAVVPGQSSGTLVAFNVSASDGSSGSRFPAEAPDRECLIRWGESMPSGSLGTYRMWLTDANVAFWNGREKNANDPIDATFVYGNYRVVYNVDTLYSGSPFHVGAYSGPLGSTCDYEINFQPGERFLGSEPFVLAGEDTVFDDFWDDTTTQIDLTGTWVGRMLGQQYNYRRHVHMFVNGSQRGDIYLDTQQPNGEMLDEYFSNESNVELRKIESWFEFADNFLSQGSVYARIARKNNSLGEIDTKWYRWTWRPRATDDHNNWYNLTNLVTEVNDSSSPDWEGRVRQWMDVRNFLRPIATHHVCGSWDSYAYERGKNMYAVKPGNKGWRLMMWDIELAMSNAKLGDYRYSSIYTTEDPVLFSMMTSIPSFHREYLMAIQEAVDRPFAPGVADPILYERYDNLLANGVPVDSPQPIIDWISDRRAYLQGFLPDVPFAVDGPSLFTNATESVAMTGTAPLQVDTIRVNGIAYPIEWTGTTSWQMVVPLSPGTNMLSFVGMDRFGDSVYGAVVQVTVISTGGMQDPRDAVVINEWMADNDSVLMDPVDNDYEDWFELYNTGTNSVDLGGCYLTDELDEPFEFMVPSNGHYIIPAGGYLLVWADDEPEQNATNHPALHVGFSLSKEGESIGLYAPDGHQIDAVTFGPQASDRSEGRCPAGAATILPLLESTPGAANSLPADGPLITDFQVASPAIGFSFGSVSGLYYQVYCTPDLHNSYWIPLGVPLEGTGDVLSFTNTVDGLPQCFFRIGLSFSGVSQSLTGTSIDGSDIIFSWDSIENMHYRVLYKNNLQDADWMPLGDPVPGSGEKIDRTNTTTEASQRFYLLGVEL